MITTALVMSLFTGCGTKESGSNTAKKDDYITVLVQGGSPHLRQRRKQQMLLRNRQAMR